ncbi:MAG TPA: hypothetical protein VEK39_08320 [Solirubrobacterales bacterium]|nr:hypothetical protein [Solirubrobacterales bacterium]
MIIFTNSWKIWLAGLAVSLGIFAIIYFTVIQDANDQADKALEQSNKAIEQGLQQSQQALDQSQQQLDQQGQNGGGGAAGNANEQIDEAQQLTQCISEAGTDTDAIQECQAQFGP